MYVNARRLRENVGDEEPMGTAEERPAEGFDRGFTVKQVAQILGTSSATVRRLLKEGRIWHQQVSDRRVVVRESAVRAYLEEVTRGRRP